jgi:hypothetical protein
MVGQINRGTTTGEFIYNLCLKEEVQTVVEIGTWNGMGSTKCIADALLQRFDNSKLISLETNKKMYNLAKTYWEQKLLSCNSFMKEKICLINGRIIEKEELLSLEELRGYSNYILDWETWHKEDVFNIELCENVLNTLPLEIDLLLLDGGEFSTFSEFNKLKDRTKYILCDDTRTAKCSKVVEELKKDANFQIIFDNQTDNRNGFTAFKKI